MRESDLFLTAEEQACFDQIQFDQSQLTYETHQRNADLIEGLFGALKARDALPEHRLRWFTDPEFNPGGRGKSRQDQWAANGTRNRDILRHPNFLSIFDYFVCGPSLPARALAEFRQAVENCGLVTSSDIPVLSKLARTLARRHGLEAHNASDEFYKLALDCGLGGRAGFIRDGVRTLRY